VNPVERLVRGVDGFQQRHRAGVVVAVARKFGDDNGGSLAGLLVYYGFLSLFPAMLLLVTVLGFLMGADSDLEERVLTSALRDFPIIGDQLRDAFQEPLRGSGVGLVIGVVGSVWGALGVTQAGQHAMAEVWNVPRRLRPNFVRRLARGLAFLLGAGTGIGLTSVLTGLRTAGLPSALGLAINVAATLAVNIALFFGVYYVLTPRLVPPRRLVPGAVAAGVGWSGLQALGSQLVEHLLQDSTAVYGFFGLVLGLFSWLSLAAQLTLYCAELNVVLAKRLWPRSLVQPPLTEADRRTLVDLAEQEERRPEENVAVHFDEAESEKG